MILDDDTTHEFVAALLMVANEDSYWRELGRQMLRYKAAAWEELWINSFDDHEPRIRLGAVLATRVFANTDRLVWFVLSKTLADIDERVRYEACSLAATSGIGPLESIHRLLRDPSWFVRQAAIESSVRIDPLSPTTSLHVTALLSDPTPQVRATAASALAALPHAVDSRQNLLFCLRDPEPQVRRAASQSLARLAPGDAIVAAALSDLLHDRDFSVRHAACTGLRSFGPTAILALDALIENLQVSDPELRSVGREAIVAIGLDAVKSLVHAARSSNDTVRLEAVRALGELPAHNPIVIATLEKLLWDESWRVRLRAVEALWKTSGHVNVETVVDVLQSGPQPAVAALRCIGRVRLRSEVIVQRLTVALTDGALAVRCAAAVTVAQLRLSDEKIARLVALLLDESDNEAVVIGVRVLGIMGSHAACAIPNLALLLNAADEDVRIAAVRALQRITVP